MSSRTYLYHFLLGQFSVENAYKRNPFTHHQKVAFETHHKPFTNTRTKRRLLVTVQVECIKHTYPSPSEERPTEGCLIERANKASFFNKAKTRQTLSGIYVRLAGGNFHTCNLWPNRQPVFRGSKTQIEATMANFTERWISSDVSR